MEEDEQEQRRRKVEAGRAKLAHFRQRKTKGDCAHSKKKTAKRKGSAVHAPVQEESPVAAEDSGLFGVRDVYNTCCETPDGATGAFAAEDRIYLPVDQNQLEIKNAQARITELEAKLLSRQETIDRLGLEVKDLQDQLAQRSGSVPCQQAHDQEHELETAEHSSRQNDEGGRQQRTQTVPSLELEALRLSLSNMHTAQLELTQANLQREKETALTELREMLNSRRAQELALLQSRQQHELELLREQHAREKEEMALRSACEAAELKEQLQSEVEKNVQMMETLKQDWESERALCLENLRKELSAKHQSEMEELQNQFQKELAEQKAELEKIFEAKDQAEFTLRNLEAQHQEAVEKLRADLQSEHCQYLEDLELKFKEKEKEKQLELEALQASYEDLKAQSQEEIRRLCSELDCMRADRQELTEFPEQLLVHAAHVEELEHLKQGFAQEQQRQKTEYESEMEQLRIYFEKKLRDAEKTYQEDLTLLQQRLQEVKEDFPLESVEISSSCVFFEEMSEDERKDHLDQLYLQPGHDMDNLTRLHVRLEESCRRESATLSSPLHLQREEDTEELEQEEQCHELELLRAAPAKEDSQGHARVCLQTMHDVALQVDMDVATRVLGLETENKVKLSLLQTELKEEIELLKIENRNLHEKLQHEVRLKEDLEKVKHNLVADHEEELNKAKEKIQLMKQDFRKKEAEWKVTSEGLEREAEEKLTMVLLELKEKAESEKRLMIKTFELREAEMRRLQDQQAAQILALERSVVEQQDRLRQLECGLLPGDEAVPCSQCGRELPAAQDRESTVPRLKEDCALQLMLAQNRFLEERREMTEKFTAEQAAFLREAQEKHAHELQCLRDRHQQQLLSLRMELETRHRAELGELTASLESEQWARLEARVAELQGKHAADISALETRHLSNLDSLEACYLSEVQAIRAEHRRALELLQADLEEQLREKDSSHQTLLTQELEKLRLNHDAELQSAKDSLRAEMSAGHAESLRALAARLQGAHQEELAAALRDQRHLLEEERVAALDRVGAEVLLLERQHQAALQELGDAHMAKIQQQEPAKQAESQATQAPLEQVVQGEFGSEKKAALQEPVEAGSCGSEQAQLPCPKEAAASLRLQLQEKSCQMQQLENQVLSLNQEVEGYRSELERLQQRHARETQEGTNLISMLRADIDLSHSERRALQDVLRKLLGLFGETVKAAIALRSRISERVGLCLDDAGTAEGDGLSAAPALEETWPDAALLDLDRALPECAEMSSVAEISSHVCESFFLSPESTLECEQPVRRVYQSLSMAVDGLLEMTLDSTRQLEEARQIHSRFEKEFSHKNEEMAQVIKKHKELLDCLKEEGAAKTALTLELHKAEGLLEGCKVEKADLQEALGLKEESEQRLALELDGLRRQLQQEAQAHMVLKEEYSVLQGLKEAAAATAEEREAGAPVTVAHMDSALRKEVEYLTREQLETRKQAEKDREALLAQMGTLELELEEQLAQHRDCARQAEEVAALKQEMAALDKHLRSQRQFMDEQAAEREHEREEFQQEIDRLELQLRQAAKPQPPGPRDSWRAQLDEEIESLLEKLREKSDGFNELAIKKESADRQVLIQGEEIKRLEEANASSRRKVLQLQEELERQKKTVKELEQDKEALKEQQTSTCLFVCALHSEPDAGSRPVPPLCCPSEQAGLQLEAAQRALLQRESEVLELKEQLEKIKDDLMSKNEEILHLNLKLDVQNNRTAASLRERQEENDSLQVILHEEERDGTRGASEPPPVQQCGVESEAPSKVVYDRSSEIEELKAIIENLQENQERLQKDKAEEIEQLHEVIEKLQSELSLMGPVVHEVSDSQADSLQHELLCCQVEGPAVLQGELEAAHAAKQALSQLLADQERGHSQALEAVQQRLRGAEEAAARQLVELGRSVALREAEVQSMASRIQEFEAVLKAKEATIAERNLEIAAMNKWKAFHCTELQAILLAVARFRHALEQQPLAALDEPLELQRLRAQCVRLSRQLQALNQRFLRCQRELDKQQAHGAAAWTQVPGGHPNPCVDTETAYDDDFEQLTSVSRGPDHDPQHGKVLVTLKDAGLQRQDSVMSVLEVCQRQLESELLLVKNEMCLCVDDSSKVLGRRKGKERRLDGCQLWKVDLVAQVKQLQEKLNRLVYSLAFQNIDNEAFKLQQASAVACACVQEGSLDDGSHSPVGTAPGDAFDFDKTTWDLVDGIKNRDSWIGKEMPNVPIQEKLGTQDGSLSLQTRVHSDSCALSHAEEAKPLTETARMLDLSSWSSPEVLRKDSTLEPQPSLPLTPCSGALSLCSAGVSPPERMGASLLQSHTPGLLSSPGDLAGQPLCWAESPSADHNPVERMAAEKDIEDFIITSFDSQNPLRSPPLGLEGKSNGSETGDSSGCGAMLSAVPGESEAPTTGPEDPAPFPEGLQQPLATMKKEVHPKQVKALLQMVCDESHQILALSESRDPPSALSRGEPHSPLHHLSSEGRGLLEVAPDTGEKESPDPCFDWRGTFLQAVREALAVELQPRLCGTDPGDPSSLLQRLEKVIREQGDLQEKSLEHLRLADRSSLLSEIQALRAQLRMTHLQNQEKLQQLCAALTSAEARGSRQEHQLRRQVELLAYKVEQEKCIASDLQKTLSEEQEKTNDVRKLLVTEQNAVKDLKSELCECKQENERLLQSLDDVQKEVIQLRSVLDSKENDLQAVLQQLERERTRERALQSQLEEEQLQHLQREAQSSKSLEELRLSLEKQSAQHSRLCVALKHEQTAKDNLQKELQIEYSRCEALLAQERGQLAELQKSLDAERSRTLELSEALQHERLLTEQLSRRPQETQAHHALLRKLKEEKCRVSELQALLDRVQQQAAHTQRQLEAEVQKRCEELGKEKERELELQRQRDEHKIKQLQQTVRALESKETLPCGAGSRLSSPRRAGGSELDCLQERHQELEKIRQQLLGAAVLLTGFINQTVDRTIKDWTSSNEKAVTSLLHTLEDLKSELSTSPSSQKTAAELQMQLVDVLLKDNDSLTKALNTVTREKAELCKAVSRLEKTLKHHLHRGCTLSKSDRSAWKPEGTALQISPARPTPAASQEANTCNVKMEKLYLHYLRAESFRKALIYQKKYLLLLIGGFQDSEQETLSMIAHLGVFPSKADKKASASRPFTKFRTAVRVVIAISRLRFLVKKWQEVDRKGTLTQGKAPRPGRRMSRQQQRHFPPETRESSPPQNTSSGPTGDTARGPGPAAAPPGRRERSTPSPNSRLERSLTASQDPEHSLTEYIHHLEMIQRRLEGVQPDSTSKKSCRQKIKQ
ncbi:pericentrin isoform X4 [Oryctolagus cuniculus]|uniref:pericentrin isoform X4 n=1 Tax=Oryctolagus cuniculus TaxID=9986 RepID=UPI003878FF71